MSIEFSGRAEKLIQIGTNYGPLIVKVPELPIPRQIPAWRHRVFVNRAAELAKIGVTLPTAEDPPRAILLYGLRGIGKTTTMHRWTWGKSFAGGELYADFGRSRYRGEAPTSDVMTSFLLELGVPAEVIPAAPDRRVALFRTLTSRQPTLVVLDDVREVDQILDFLPSAPGSILIVTCDRPLIAFNGELELVELKRLNESNAIELLLSHRPDLAQDHVAELARLCDGHPLALQVVGARLRNGRLSTATLIAELADERRRLAGMSVQGEPIVSAALTVAYRDLPERAARLYRQLGLFPGPDFPAELASIIADALPELETLVAHGLIEQTGADRFQFPSLVRLHAADVAIDDPISLRRVFQHYLQMAMAAGHAVMGNRAGFSGVSDRAFPMLEPPLTMLVRELPNLMALLRMADLRGWNDEAWKLAETLPALFFNHRYRGDWLASGLIGIAAARLANRLDVVARLLCLTSRPLIELGRLDEAGPMLAEAVELAESHGPLWLQASAWEFRGRWLEFTDRAAAIAAYHRSIELNQLADEKRGEALARMFLGGCLDHEGCCERAVDQFQGSRRLLGEIGGQERLIGRVLTGLGTALAHLSRDDEAAETLQQAIETLQRGGWVHYEGPAAEQLAKIRVRSGDTAGARELIQRALVIESAVGGDRISALESLLHQLDGHDQALPANG